MWEIKETGFQKDKIIHHGNQFLTGHLKLGVRGTLDEYQKNELVALNLPLVYDQVGDGWREPVNSFNPLYTIIKVNDKIVSVLNLDPVEHEQKLDMKTGLMSRRSIFLVDGIHVKIYSKRFVSYVDQRAILGVYQVTCDQNAKLEIITGIDFDIWDINGPHIKDINLSHQKHLKAIGKTHEKGHIISCAKHVKPLFGYKQLKTSISNHIVMQTYTIDAIKDQTYGFEHFSVIGVNQDVNSLDEDLDDIIKIGYHRKFSLHQAVWEKKWYDADVQIQGDKEAQRALRYSIYHLIILSPNNYEHASIPARGISGQTYKGAIFWDTEIFLLPFYLNTDLESARQIITYRIRGLSGAIQKAKSYGFKGAFYAWESQENGFDACTDYNVTNVFTKRPVRTYFKDKQIHISADIVYAIKSYVSKSKDLTILKDGALEVILEVARFYLEYGHLSPLKNRFELWDVMGPDEYHERVHNNAFTNKIVHMVFQTVLAYETLYKDNNDSFFDEIIEKINFDRELTLIKKYLKRFYLKEILDNKLIEQFDGYFKHKDILLKSLLEQKLDKNEYLGGQGLAGDTQIIKQADVITMLYLFKEDYSHEVLKANWAYYEPRTEHGSSLSASMYALVACLIDKSDYAYQLFMKSATIDLTGISKQYAGDIYIGGTHPAAAGGAYMTALYGFTGLSFDKGITLKPCLPKSITSIKYKIKHHRKQFEVYVSKDKQSIKEI